MGEHLMLNYLLLLYIKKKKLSKNMAKCIDCCLKNEYVSTLRFIIIV